MNIFFSLYQRESFKVMIFAEFDVSNEKEQEILKTKSNENAFLLNNAKFEKSNNTNFKYVLHSYMKFML